MNTENFIKADKAFLYFDKLQVRRTKNLRLIPPFSNRRGGKISYGEWCHVVGIFQTLLYMNLNRKTENTLLDIGCGTGIMGIAGEPFIGNSGQYIGIDVNMEDIEFCKRHYPKDKYKFEHLDIFNPTYANDQNQHSLQWNVPDQTVDMVTALSVWTHLNEKDAVFYFNEINRVLKPEGKAIVTFFLLDKHYYETLPLRSDRPGKYHNTNQMKWIFDTSSSDSEMWFHPGWARQPEDAVGVSTAGLSHLVKNTCLSIEKSFPGNWKEVPGIFFQDVIIFKKD